MDVHPIGSTIAHYRILEELGRGGMGIVYRALDTRLERIVALKFLSTDQAGSEVERERFLLEARAAAGLHHPNICSVIDFNEDRGREFLVMESVEGRSLRALLTGRPMDIPLALNIAGQIADGLVAAHERGVVHRDLKPENILVTHAGAVKITDFGLAALSARKEEPGETAVAGTPAYMSPEQSRGDRVTALTDIWSAGVILYEMTTGQRPFEGDYPQAIAYSAAQEKHRPPMQVVPGFPRGVEEVIDRCLEKDPSRRYASSRLLAEALRALEAGLKKEAGVARKSIAVLPFTDISPEKDNEYFSDGLTEEIIAGLAKLKLLRVVSRTSVMRIDRTGKSSKQLADELGVKYLLEGSVRKHGSDLRITTQLIDALEDNSLWAEIYTGTLEEIFDFQETVASRIAKALKLKLTPREKHTLKRRPTKNSDAYQLYLKGRFFWNKRNREALETALGYFEEAIRLDSGYALAWAGIADSYTLLNEYGSMSRKQSYANAKDAAERALALDNRLAEAWTSSASVKMLDEWNWTDAGKEFARALKLNPAYATAHHWAAEWFLYTGNVERAIMEINEAARLDPLSPAIIKDRGMTFYYARQYDAAIGEGRRTLELNPEFGTAHRLLSLALLEKRLFDQAISENRLWQESTGNDPDSISLAYILAVAGRRREAEEIIGRLDPGHGPDGNELRSLAFVFVALDDYTTAFRWLSAAFDQRAESLCSLKVDPKADRLRQDPRFEALVAKIGLNL